MPWLSNAAHSFQIVLGEAKSTADLSWTAWFKDTDAGARTSKPGTPAFGVTNGIAAVQMFTGPASGLTRDLTSFTCFNADDVAHKIQVQVYDGVNTYSIVNEPTLQNVPVGATLCWDELEG